MAPLKLTENFKVKTLFSSHNATNGGEIVLDPSLITFSSCAAPLYESLKAPIIISYTQCKWVVWAHLKCQSTWNSTQTSINVEPLAKKQCKNYDATQKW
jgi:hypothetical protein